MLGRSKASAPSNVWEGSGSLRRNSTDQPRLMKQLPTLIIRTAVALTINIRASTSGLTDAASKLKKPAMPHISGLLRDGLSHLILLSEIKKDRSRVDAHEGLLHNLSGELVSAFFTPTNRL